MKFVWQISYTSANGASLGSYFCVKNLTSALKHCLNQGYFVPKWLFLKQKYLLPPLLALLAGRQNLFILYQKYFKQSLSLLTCFCAFLNKTDHCAPPHTHPQKEIYLRVQFNAGKNCSNFILFFADVSTKCCTILLSYDYRKLVTCTQWRKMF